MYRILYVLIFLVLFGCSKEYYRTREGRIKQNYYNGVQYNNKEKKQKYQKRYNKILKKGK